MKHKVLVETKLALNPGSRAGDFTSPSLFSHCTSLMGLLQRWGHELSPQHAGNAQSAEQLASVVAVVVKHR